MEAIELLEGVEILSMGEPTPLALGIFLVVLCLFVIGLSAYLLVDSAKYGSAGGVFLSLLFIGIGILLFTLILQEIIIPTPTYKVTVEDSVSMNEFYEKYEVLSVDGKIYTIEERKQ